ncbi:MAG: hypothetical protein GY953_46165 [bacterium]|nr:hypothetical protein [bacterium]
MWRSSTFLLAVGLLLAGLQTFSQDTTGRENLLRATLVNGRFEFSPPVPVDWRRLAPRHLVDFEIEHPEPGFLSELVTRQDMFNNAEIRFEAPLPRDLQTYVFYLISESGVEEIHAIRLEGTVRYSLDDQGSIASRTLFGYVTATPGAGDPSPPAGLVRPSPAHRDFETRASTLDVRQLVPVEVRKQWDTLPEKARRFWTIERQYSFQFDGDDVPYTFVQWTPDKECYEACCEIRYSVLAGEQPPRLVAGYGGQCDI